MSSSKASNGKKKREFDPNTFLATSKEGVPETVVPKISQETMGDMVEPPVRE